MTSSCQQYCNTNNTSAHVTLFLWIHMSRKFGSLKTFPTQDIKWRLMISYGYVWISNETKTNSIVTENNTVWKKVLSQELRNMTISNRMSKTLWSNSVTSNYRINQGVVSIKKCRLTSIGIRVLKIRRSRGRLFFNMGIPIHGKDGIIVEKRPRCI